VLLVSGGIGPTEDDLTRQALAAVMGEPLLPSSEWLAELEAFFRKVNRPMSPLNRVQAMIPRGARMIFNSAGTAAGIHETLSNGGRRCEVFVMPGVPKEMKIMFARDVLPRLTEIGAGAVILSRTLHTFGLGESAVAEKLGPLMTRGRNPSVGTTVSGGIVSLRINANFPSRARAASELEESEVACRRALGPLIFGQDDETLQGVLAKMVRDAGKTIATAESCTGGLLAKMLTDVPGSSAFFQQGWITYSNAAKTKLLSVPPALIEQHGAVSEPVAAAMATAAATLAGASFGIGISGIAGPDGGTPAKPVGTVCIALHVGARQSCAVRTFVLSGDREMIRDRSAKMALTLLRFDLLGQPLPF
jgi:nicotinamide-nucleotide amidase